MNPPILPIAADANEIRSALGALVAPGDVTELRVVNTHRGTVSGYYQDLDALARDAELWSGKGPAVYFLPQPVMPDLLARACNRYTEYARSTTADPDILRRSWLLIDCDAERPAGISASETEWQAALERARQIAQWLTDRGWGGVGVGDSGNGGHVLAPIALPNDAEAEALVKRCLAALAVQFDDSRVRVDPTTYNAARVWKLYGTLSAKGDAIPGRLHRLARLLQLPDRAACVSREQLEALAELAPAPTSRSRSNGHGASILAASSATLGHGSPSLRRVAPDAGDRGDYATLDVVRWFTAHGAYGRSMGRGQHAVQCPWEHEHSQPRRPEDSDTTVWEAENGAWPQFHCLHAHCSGRTITNVMSLWGDADRFCSAAFAAMSWPVAPKTPPKEPTSAPPDRAERAELTEALESIDPLWRINTDPPRYEATVNERVLNLAFGELVEWARFKPAVIRILNYVPFLPYKTGRDGKALSPQVVWERFLLNPALRRMEEEGRIREAPSDAGDAGAAWESVLLFFRSMRKSELREDLHKDRLVLEDGNYLFRGRTLRQWLAKNHLDNLKPSDLWDVVRQQGGTPQVVKAARKSVSVWSVPASATEEKEHDDADD